ncbi:RsmE family RNA methyltransferase, partial [Bacteroidia bacterium]|nr:RsmE family RNA methyltransferase [Bacteroidia bacterium]
MPGHFTFYTEEIKNNQAVFSESESKHMVQVLRYSQGDIIEFTNGKGTMFKGSLLEANRKSVVAKVEEKTTSDIPDTVLVLGILKSSDRMETVVEKCVELGINTIHLMPSENSERKKVNLDKLHKTAIAAMKQSH